MPDVLLATKLHIPPLHGSLVSRPRLIQRLNAGIAQNHRLLLISAPAGYGKSTLLSEWVSRAEMPAAWLSLGPEENIPHRFWTYVVTALACLPAVRQAAGCESILQGLQSPQPPPIMTVLTNLMNVLAQISGEIALVLDDLHTITEPQIHQDLVFLIDHLPRSGSGLHLVAASRMDPPWPLARWRGRGELTELRPADLRFSHPEMAQFLNQTLRLQLSAHDIHALQARTEGWIAGLQMAVVSIQARLSAQGPEGVSRFIESLTGSNRFILDYLMEEVIGQLTQEMRDFLLATSILDQFTAPLCDALLERQDSRVVLDQVERANLFLVPLDDERQWYRYHHLFADLLQKSLKQTHPELVGGLHQRASEWYAANNYLAEAIGHALDAGDVVRVNKFVAGNALAMTENTELQDVLRHFEQIPEADMCAKPWLCVAYAWVKAYVDPSQGIGRILHKVMESISGVEDAVERQQLISHLDAIWAYVAWVKGEPETALEFARSALAGLPDDDWLTRCHVLHTQGAALQNLDRLPESTQAFEAAILAGQRTNKIHETYYAQSCLAYVNILQGHLHRAAALCQQVLSQADQAGFVARRLPVLAYAYATLSMVQREWNDVENAIRNAREGVALAELWRQADTLHFTLTCLSEALRAAGDLESAYAANQRAMQLGVTVSTWFVRISSFGQIHIHLAQGDVAAASHLFSTFEDSVTEPNRKGLFLIAKASLLYALGRFTDTLSLVESSMGELEQKGKVWVIVKLLPLQALALQALSRADEALTVLTCCLAIARPEGYRRIFLDQGAPMCRLLHEAARRGIEVEYITALLPAFNLPAAPRTSPVPASHGALPQFPGAVLVEPLSERELHVLRLLDSPLTSEEIGRELFISANTVRTHMRNIYAKLDAHGRLEALQKARQLKLM